MKRFRLMFILFLLLFGIIFNIETAVVSAGDPEASKAVIRNYNVITGDWQRPDGSYVFKIRDPQQDGSVDVSYFNPRPVNVSEAAVSTEKNLIKLYVLFQDKGYEGSNYILYYYPQKDILIGFYHQAPMGKTYEVLFFRRP